MMIELEVPDHKPLLINPSMISRIILSKGSVEFRKRKYFLSKKEYYSFVRFWPYTIYMYAGSDEPIVRIEFGDKFWADDWIDSGFMDGFDDNSAKFQQEKLERSKEDAEKYFEFLKTKVFDVKKVAFEQ